MPPLNATESNDAVPVPVLVEKRVKDLNQATWAVRTSTHSDTHVKFSELADVLAKDHSRNEAIYTPSVFDAIELLKWDHEELLEAVQQSGHQEEIHSVEMFISQMFHMMPKVAGLSLLQDRVFHVLVVTANTYQKNNPSELSKSFTVQLPIDYASFGDVEIMQEMSRMKARGSSQCYHFPSNAESGLIPDAHQKQRQGKKLTEGTYVSLERLTRADSANNHCHRWDMMTLSTAGGMTRRAPKGVQQKETLEAIAMDVGKTPFAMQNYGQAPSYQRPGSTTSFTGQAGPPPVPPPPPGYGASQGYQTSAPQAHGQWAAPTPTHTSSPWNQAQQQGTGGYNPGTYGTMPGAQHHPYHPPPQQDQPPPPPPKPHGFAAAVQRQEQQQQSTQNWSHQPQQPQQNTGYAPHAQQGGYPVQETLQQHYHHAAPLPSPVTQGRPNFPPSHGGRPSSIYGTAQVGSYSNAPSAVPQQPSAVISPNEQQPAYTQPPSNVHGTPAYMSANTNPTPSAYVPPPPVAPTWQQPQHAAHQGGANSFTQPKPIVDTGFYSQDYHSAQQQQAPPLPPRYGLQSAQHPEHHQPQYGHSTPDHYPPPSQTPHQLQQLSGQYPPPPRQHQHQGHFGGALPAQQQPVGQPVYSQAQSHQQPVQQHGYSVYEQHGQSSSQDSHFQRPWQPASPAPEPSYQHNTAQPYEPQQQSSQSGYQAQNSFSGQQYSQTTNQEIQEPKPFNDTATSNFYHQPSPPSQPVSPISNRPSLSSASGYQHVSGRTDSVSSIALANLYAQRAENKTSSPKPLASKLPIPPPPRDDKSRFSVLAAGAPSDWEHLGGSEEIDDEELFGVKKEEKQSETTQPGSVELPAHVPSPSSTHGFPSPAVRPAHVSSSEWDKDYTPTPPSVTTSLAHRQASQSSDQGSVVEDAIVAPLKTTPKPIHGTKPPYQPAALITGSATAEGEWNTSQHTPTQPKNHFEVQTSKESKSAESSGYDYTVQLKEKDDLIHQLRADAERGRAELHAKIEALQAENQKLSSEHQASKTHSTSEMIVLRAQIENMRTAADQATVNSEALVKEKNTTIERLKEDVEGKEHNIEERDSLVVELKRQLEAERLKELPKPTPTDLISDIDPWYVGSLERYIAMLRSEAAATQVEEKIKIFKAFMRAECSMRAINFFDASTQTLPVEPGASHEIEQAARSRATSKISNKRQDLNIQVPHESAYEDDYEYSPGGRPIVARPSMLPSIENYQGVSKASPSVVSTAILTPTSSIDDDTNKTPVQSLPEEQMQPQYKAYVPPASISVDPPQLRHRQTMSFSNTPVVASPSGHRNSKGHDEIFFGAHQATAQTPDPQPPSIEADVPLPAPLNLTSRRPASTAAPSKDGPNQVLKALLPKQIEPDLSNRRIQDLRAKLADIESRSSNTEQLAKTWEKSTSLSRRKRDDARRKRQEENEEHNDDLFNNNEISYAEMNQLEEEFKQKEAELKAQEDRDEYQSYVDAVFDPEFTGLHGQIKALMDLYVEAKQLLQSSVRGLRSLEQTDDPSTKDCLKFVRDVHEQIEKRHDSVAQLVAERDRRYKKTETQPLYAAGNISQMKIAEKHFENAEKQAVFGAKREKAERISELVRMTEGFVVDAVGDEQKDIDIVIAAIKDLEDGTGDPEVLSHAQATLEALKKSSKDLLSLFNTLEIESNNADINAEIAQVKADSADAERIGKLEAEKKEAERELVAELERRIRVLDSNEGEIRELIQKKMGERNEDAEKEERLRTALEEAKRRNGHA
ncbi:hypothetical protein ACET3X_008326 [Alternaria dauci]|uniref:DUF3074 domain-containing protein n=1 Tax=Alternaria dauci TaxID=48095 RepID=A0ABR3UAK7_9PLEO